jgi:hypothetical protein
MLLITTFVAAGRSRTQAGRPHAVSGRPRQFTRAMPCPCRTVPWPWEVAFRRAWSWQGTGAAWHVWIKHGRTVLIKWERQSKPLAAWQGRGTAWERHCMCELAFKCRRFGTLRLFHLHRRVGTNYRRRWIAQKKAYDKSYVANSHKSS